MQIIVTCDGFTDGAGGFNQSKRDHENYLLNILKNENCYEADYLSKSLAHHAKEDGSSDNISIIVQTLDLENNSEPLLLGVYDGHGGSEASTYAARNVTRLFVNYCVENFPFEPLFKIDTIDPCDYYFLLTASIALAALSLAAFTLAALAIAMVITVPGVGLAGFIAAGVVAGLISYSLFPSTKPITGLQELPNNDPKI